MSSRFFPHKVILTDAVLSLDEDSVLSTNEVSLSKLSDSHLVLCSDQLVLCLFERGEAYGLSCRSTVPISELQPNLSEVYPLFSQVCTRLDSWSWNSWVSHGAFHLRQREQQQRKSMYFKVRTSNSGCSSVFSRSSQVQVGVV